MHFWWLLSSPINALCMDICILNFSVHMKKSCKFLRYILYLSQQVVLNNQMVDARLR
jgi:hypothetical protein